MRALPLLLLAGWLAGCAAVPTPLPPGASGEPAGTQVPEKLTRCPAGPQRPAAPPAEPPTPRPVEALLDWAAGLVKAIAERDDALEAAIGARDECRRRLGELNDWINERLH